jgi:rare lipoprotein A
MKPQLHFKFLLLMLIFTPVINASAGGYKNISQKETKKRSVILYGQASFYAAKFQGRRTASGDVFNHSKYTAACNSLPLGTLVKVTNLKNGRSIEVKINDRLHAKTTRLLDLTKAGAEKLGFVKAGLTRVKIEVIRKKKEN